MILSSPIPFRDAIRRRAVQSVLPTNLSSAELSRLPVDIRERSLSSARNHHESVLDELGQLIDGILQPHTEVDADGNPHTVGVDMATARMRLQAALERVDYDPEAQEGSIQDLGSDARLNLVLETNVQMAQGYGKWRQSQDDDVIDSTPALELYRLEDRRVPRDWAIRWLSAAGEVGDDAASKAFRVHGRMVARKDSPIWTALSRFGQPYPPFDFNSGMDVRNVGYRDAVALGVMTPGDRVTPQIRPFELSA